MISEKVTTGAAYGASGVTIVAGLTVNEFVALGGLTLAIITFLINIWFKHQHLKLDEQRTKIAKGKDDATST